MQGKRWTEILRDLPELDCKRCGGCCGPVPCSKSEFIIIKGYVEKNNILPVRHRDPISCSAFSKDNGCLIYEVRPVLCRLMGHSAKMPCRFGCNVDIPKEQEDAIMAGYSEEAQPGTVHFISEVWGENNG